MRKKKIEQHLRQVETENFDQFQSKFYSDSIFQLSRIDFPLEGYNSDDISDIPSDFAEQMGIEIANDDDYHWDKEDWLLIQDLDDNVIERSILRTDSLIIENFIIPNSGFEIIREFKLKEDKWYLVYYFYRNT